jgi:hypothetical protein
MALTNRVTKRVDLVHEPGQWVDIRMPSLAILDAAKVIGLHRMLESVKGLDLSQFERMQSKPQESDPGSGYDWQTLLGACVVAWSYGEPVTPENIRELDEATVKALLALLVPLDTEADRKNA